MEHDEFKITLISPALLSGNDPQKADPNGFRGSSIRGMWRFWARAMWAGLKDNIPVSTLKELEKGLFGSTEQKSFRMKIKPEINFSIKTAQPLPHRQYKGLRDNAMSEGSTFSVLLYWPLGWDENCKKALAGIIHLWSILGSIGQRSRRGFGSVRLHHGTGYFDLKSLLDNDNLHFPAQFESQESLNAFIKNSVGEIAKIQQTYMAVNGIDVPFNSINAALGGNEVFQNMFTLKSIHQIAVGNPSPRPLFDGNDPDRSGMIWLLHGRGTHNRDEHGAGRQRLASPIYVRLHQIKQRNGREEFVPVGTMSYRKRSRFNIDFRNWLDEMGFGVLLPPSSLMDYPNLKWHSGHNLTSVKQGQRMILIIKQYRWCSAPHEYIRIYHRPFQLV